MDGEPVTKSNTENSNNGNGMGLAPGIEINRDINSLPKEVQQKILEPGLSAEKANKVVEEATKKDEEIDVNKLSDKEYYEKYGNGMGY